MSPIQVENMIKELSIKKGLHYLEQSEKGLASPQFKKLVDLLNNLDWIWGFFAAAFVIFAILAILTCFFRKSSIGSAAFTLLTVMSLVAAYTTYQDQKALVSTAAIERELVYQINEGYKPRDSYEWTALKKELREKFSGGEADQLSLSPITLAVEGINNRTVAHYKVSYALFNLDDMLKGHDLKSKYGDFYLGDEKYNEYQLGEFKKKVGTVSYIFLAVYVVIYLLALVVGIVVTIYDEKIYYSDSFEDRLVKFNVFLYVAFFLTLILGGLFLSAAATHYYKEAGQYLAELARSFKP